MASIEQLTKLYKEGVLTKAELMQALGDGARPMYQAPPVAAPGFPRYVAANVAPAMPPAPEGFGWTRTGKLAVDHLPTEGQLPCPNCGKGLEPKDGQFGPFMGCDRKTGCGATFNVRGHAKKMLLAARNVTRAEPIATGHKCPTCNKGHLQIREGRRGLFIGCDQYPACDHTAKFTADMLTANATPAVATPATRRTRKAV